MQTAQAVELTSAQVLFALETPKIAYIYTPKIALETPNNAHT